MYIGQAERWMEICKLRDALSSFFVGNYSRFVTPSWSQEFNHQDAKLHRLDLSLGHEEVAGITQVKFRELPHNLVSSMYLVCKNRGRVVYLPTSSKSTHKSKHERPTRTKVASVTQRISNLPWTMRSFHSTVRGCLLRYVKIEESRQIRF